MTTVSYGKIGSYGNHHIHTENLEINASKLNELELKIASGWTLLDANRPLQENCRHNSPSVCIKRRSSKQKQISEFILMYPINVLQISMRSDEGGGPKLMLELATRLKMRSLKAFIACPRDEPYGPRAKKLADSYIEIPCRKWSISTLCRLRRFCRRNKVDVIHAHGFGAGLYGRLLGLPVVYQPHGTHKPQNVVSQLKVQLDKWLLHFTSTVLYISESEQTTAYSLNLKPRSAKVIPNPLLGKPIIRGESYQLPQISLGTLSRLDPIKRHTRLIELYRAYNNSGSKKAEIKLTILGDGEARADIVSKIGKSANDVELLPSTNDPYPYLSKLDVFVSASRSEGFGLAAIEAMATGIPCLLSSVPGHLDFIERGWAVGFVAEDTQSFIEGLNYILDGSFRKPDPILIRKVFDPDIWIAKILAVYQAVLNGKLK